MENSRLSKIVMIGSFILLATLVVGYLYQAFFKKDDDKAEREKMRELRAREVEELARMNDLLQQQLEETEKLPAVKKGAQVIELTPEKKELAPRKNPPAPGKKRKQNPPQPQGKKAETPAPVVAGTL